MTPGDGLNDGETAPRPSAASQNHGITEYLDAYLAFPHDPGSAVALIGPWGSGKTHLVRSWQRTRSKAGEKILMVSLYGLTSRAEVLQALMRSSYPAIKKLEATASRGPTAKTTSEPPYVPSAAAYIFDDLERCSMSIVEAMGLLNQLVESDGLRVILLANEEAMSHRPDGAEYESAKEKTVGRSFVVRPDSDAAFDAFAAKVDFEPSRSLLIASRKEIADLFRQSELPNLRTLQQAMWDFERLHRGLTEEHRANSEAMSSLLRLVLALSFEVREGRIVAEDLTGRLAQIHSGLFDEAKPRTALAQAARRYPGVPLYDTVLPDDVLRTFLIEGRVDREALRRGLDESSWFLAEEEPSWRTLSNSYQRADEDSARAAEALIKEFEAREFARTGEILNVFAQMLKLGDYGFTGWSPDQTVQECKRYVDDLRKQGRLEPPVPVGADDARYGLHDGVSFDRPAGEEFDDLYAYVAEQRAQAEIDRHPEVARRLLDLLKTEPAAFVAAISPRGAEAGGGKYAKLPILRNIDPQEAALVMAELSPLQLNDVLQTLSGRFELDASSWNLRDELPWLRQVRDALVGISQGKGVFGSKRIEEMVALTLTPRINAFPRQSGLIEDEADVQVEGAE